MSVGTKIGSAFAVGLLLLAAVGGGVYVNTEHLLEANRSVVHTYAVQAKLDDVLAAHLDAETGQRGYIITGDERYLEPYNAGRSRVRQDIQTLAELTRDNPSQHERLQQVRKLSDAKLAELQETIRLRKESGLKGALPVVLTNRGKKIMDDLRKVVAGMEAEERTLMENRVAAAQASAAHALWTIVAWVPLALVVLAVAAIVLMRTARFGGAVAVPPGKTANFWVGVAIRYGLAVVLVAVAILLRWRLVESLGPMPLFITFYPAVLLVASIAGGGPGVLVTILSALAADYWFIPPYHSFSISTPNDAIALGIFTAANLGLCVLAERLRRARWAEALATAHEERAEELARQNEELAQQSEELSQQAEELSQQSEELSGQNEELQAQSEEIQSLNDELHHREDLLQTLLETSRLAGGEQAAMQEICTAALRMFGEAAAAVVVGQKQAERLVIRAIAANGRVDVSPESLPTENSFAELAVHQNRTASLNDASLRPDLAILPIPGLPPFQAELCAPMQRAGEAFGVVAIYSSRPQEWTAEQFRLAEWLASQCAQILETLRVQQELARMASFPTLNPNPIVEADFEGRVCYANPAARRLLPDIQQRGADHPWLADWPAVMEACRAGRSVSGRDVAVGGCFYHQTIHFMPQTGRIRTYGFDITERKRAERVILESEQRFRSFVEATTQVVWTTNPRGEVDMAIPSWQAFTGQSADEAQGFGWMNAIRPEDRSRVAAAWQKAFETSGLYEVEYLLQTHDGSWRNILARGVPIRNPDGSVREYVGVCIDITARKKAEEELMAAKAHAERAQAAAELANNAKDRFLAILSHELRTPLTPVVMGVSLLQDRQDLAAEVRNTLEMIGRNVQIEARLIDDLLDVMRIGRGKMELRRSTIELCSVINGAIEVCKPDIEARGLHFGLDPGPAAPYWVEGDVARLQQVFWNLLKNAIKFTPRGGYVGIRCRSEPGHVLAEVYDSGIGIEAEALPHIFNAFEQAERSITRQFGGLGLGLTISKALVEMHGGTIEALSEGRDRGATFRLRLPLTAPACRPEGLPPVALPRHRGRPLRVLLVEDHDVTATMMQTVLTAEGHKVEMAADIATALELAGQNHFDLLLSDLGLPDGSGHDLVRQLRQRGHRFPAVALSGYGQEDDIRRSREAGFAAHLIKPASRETVVAAVASIADGNGDGVPANLHFAAMPQADAPVFDPEAALRHCMAKPEVVAQMIEFFFRDFDELLPQIRAALQRGDMAAVGDLAHRLKGTVNHLAAEPAKQAARRVEQFGRTAGSSPADAEEAVEALERACQLLREALLKHRAAAVSPPRR